MSRFANLDPRHTPHGLGAVLEWGVWDRLTGQRRRPSPGPPAPRVAPDLHAIGVPGGPPRVTWIGHSSFLMTLGGSTALVDPVFSRRIGWTVTRHGAAGLTPEALPRVDALLVTHNHFDHLDAPSLRTIDRGTAVFAPRGLGRWFARRGFSNVHEMRWWDTRGAAALTITFVPARHWSRRTPWDTNRSHWGGFVVRGGGATVYHAGDSGWFGGFRAIGRRFPGIDVALLPVGGYDPAWFMEQHHMTPEQAGEAFLALGARSMMPMHWGAFRLTDEPLIEPVERLERWWGRRRPDGRLHVPKVGETVALLPGGRQHRDASRRAGNGVWATAR